MTYDHDSRSLVTVTLEDAMEAWGGHSKLEHVVVLNTALKEAHKSFDSAMKRGDHDAMLGASSRMEQYSDKMHTIIKRLATVG